jgi:tRNA pseudouridine55 synthase
VQVRRGLPGRVKVGHSGTLDPFATGLMLVLVGRGTRLQRYLVGLPKAYRAGVRFGFVSTTHDPTGALSETGAHVDEAAVQAGLAPLRGEIEQRVPAHSAVKVAGERLYRRARAGDEIALPVRAVRVERLELARFDEREQTAELEVECSSGTYVRQLVADLGELCGAGAYCTALERTRIGPFSLQDADAERVLSPNEALAFLPERVLDADEARRVRNGRPVEGGGDGPVRLTHEGDLVAIAGARDGMLRPETVLA